MSAIYVIYKLVCLQIYVGKLDYTVDKLISVSNELLWRTWHRHETRRLMRT